jgi:hypothetical protein
MAISSSPIETRLRTGFKYFNRYMLLLWRLGLDLAVEHTWRVDLACAAHTPAKPRLPVESRGRTL